MRKRDKKLSELVNQILNDLPIVETVERGKSKKTLFDKLNHINKVLYEQQRAKIKIGVIGDSGVGKSSFINLIVGKDVAKTGPIETTQKLQEYKIDENLIITDLPGCGTKEWPLETYIKRLGLEKGFDAFLLVFNSRIKKNDVELYKDLRKINKPIYFIRNAFDSAVAGEQGKPESKRLSIDELANDIRKYVREQLDDSNVIVFLVCSLKNHDKRYDLDILCEQLLNDLPQKKRFNTVKAINSYSLPLLKEKRKQSEKVLNNYKIYITIQDILNRKSFLLYVFPPYIFMSKRLIFKYLKNDTPTNLQGALKRIRDIYGFKDIISYRISNKQLLNELSYYHELIKKKHRLKKYKIMSVDDINDKGRGYIAVLEKAAMELVKV